LEALHLLGDEYRLIRIGAERMPTYSNKCNELVRKHKLDYVNLGYVPKERLCEFYSHADAFVFPSSDEGFGLPPLEAMACGTTSVLSDIPVFKELYYNRSYMTQIDPYKLADAIEKAVKNPLPEKGLIDFAHRFTWKDTALKTYDVYNEVVNGH